MSQCPSRYQGNACHLAYDHNEPGHHNLSTGKRWTDDEARKENCDALDQTLRRASLHVRVRHGDKFAGSECSAGPQAIPDIFFVTNPSIRCDALVGPCACGAWHKATEWVLVRVKPEVSGA